LGPEDRAEIIEDSDMPAPSPVSLGSQSLSLAKASSESDLDDFKSEQVPPGTLPPVRLPTNFLRKRKEEGQSPYDGREYRRKNKWDDRLRPGGPISQSAIYLLK